MLERLKLLLWKIEVYPDKCPFCGSKLVKIGFPHDICFQDYICPRGVCRFNKRK